MSYKQEFQSNNTDLQTILDMVNALPDQLDTSDATAAAGDIASGKTAWVNGAKVTGTGTLLQVVNNVKVKILSSAGGMGTLKQWSMAAIDPQYISCTGFTIQKGDRVMSSNMHIYHNGSSICYFNATANSVYMGSEYTVTGTLYRGIPE